MGLETKPPRRSLLVYSALATERWGEALTSGADMVMFDLEDGTAEPRKDEGRAAILDCFQQLDGAIGPQCLLRINSPRTAHGLRDLIAVLEAERPPSGLVLPKVRHPEEVCWVADLLAPRHVHVGLIPLIEDQAGVNAAEAIACASPIVDALFLGAVDLSGELGTGLDWDALYAARAALVSAASVAGVDCIDGPWLDVFDRDGLVGEAQRVARMGFTGKASYAASQLSAIHAAFTPTEQEIAFAKRVVAAVADSTSGGGVVDGRSVNKANAKGAERVLQRAQRFGFFHKEDSP